MTSTPNRTTRRAFMQTCVGGWMGLTAAGQRVLAQDNAEKADFTFGVIADCQYADAAPEGIRHFRASVRKLTAAVEHMNTMDLAFVIHLGDFIDRDFASFDAVDAVYSKLKMPKYHLLGNHDFEVAADKKDAVPARLGMPARYYDFAVRNWRFMVLDGNDISQIARAEDSQEYKQAQALCETLKERQAPHANAWNGAVGPEQMEWLKGKLAAASEAGEKVILFCHFPVLPANAHNLWNDQEMVRTIDSHDCVAAYLNGHNHAGNYAVKEGIHYVTIQGMVDTPDQNAYGWVEVHGSCLKLHGRGRVPDRVMTL